MSRTSSESASSAQPPQTVNYSKEENDWIDLLDQLQHTHLEPEDTPTILPGTPFEFMPHISGAHQAGMLSVTGTPSAFVPRTLDNTTAAIACQWKYYQQGVLGGVKLKLGFEKQAQQQTQNQTQNHHH